jgi:hypothetical protein
VTTRLDLALQRYPDHEAAVRLLAERDPSGGKLKYLDWGARVVASGQALAGEVADVLDLYHRFAGQSLAPAGRRSRPGQRVHPDLYTYRPSDLARLRDLLHKLQRAQDRRRRQRERLYRIEGAVEADVVYDSDDLVVRHVKNKAASAHYGRGTKWCISMLREGYFEEYEASNATFFFFERKRPIRDEYDKVALMLPRIGAAWQDESPRAFTTLDQPVDMMSLARVHGPRVFDIFRRVYEASAAYPGSAAFRIYEGTATEEQIAAALANLKSLDAHETNATIEAICCNDAAPWPLLEVVERSAHRWSIAASKRRGRRRRRWSERRPEQRAKKLALAVAAALVIHPSTPTEVRERLTAHLRKRRVKVESIRRTTATGVVAVEYQTPAGPERGGRIRGRMRRRHRHRWTPRKLRERAAMLDRAAKRMRRKARTMQREVAEKRRRKAAREKRLAAKKSRGA